MKLNGIFIRLSSLVASIIIFLGCTTEDVDMMAEVKGDNTIKLSTKLQNTRAASNLQDTQISTDVLVAVYGLSDGNTIANGDNESYRVDEEGNLIAMNNTMTWPSSGNLCIYSYAPRQDQWNFTSTTKTFTVTTDQSSNEGYLASDLIYAVAKPSLQNTVSLGFVHKMARISLMLKTNGSTSLSNATVKILNTLPSTTLSLGDGSLGSASGTSIPITMASDLALNAGGVITLYAVVVPQTIIANTTFVEVTDGEESWKYCFSYDTQFESGQSYAFTVNVGTNTVTSTISGNATTPALAPENK